jgi:sugar phosphate isomerase/epimerase
MQTALQLYTVRDALTKDVHGTLEAIGALGLDGVELAGNFGGLEPEAFKAKLDTLGLGVAGMHVPIEALEGDLTQQLELAQLFQTAWLVCPWLPEARYASGWDAVAQRLGEINSKLEGTGVGLAYHNHTFEFETHGGKALDVIAAHGVALELDIAWAHAAGVDPAAFLRAHRGRVPLVHVKDVRRMRDGAGTDAWQTVELARGEVPLHAALEAALETGAAWLILEQDHTTGDALESVRESASWLRAQLVGG